MFHLGGMYASVRVTTPAEACFLFRPRPPPGTRSTVNTTPSLPRSSSVLLSRLPVPSVAPAGAARGGGSARCLTDRGPLAMRTSGVGFLSPALSFQTCASGVFDEWMGTFLVENVPSAVEPDATRNVADLLLQHVGTQLRTKRVRGNSTSVAH